MVLAKEDFAMTASAPPVRDVTPAHYFDPAPLEAWLRREVENFGDAMVVQQFQGGASNPTFLLTTQSPTAHASTSCARSRRACCWPAPTRSTANTR